MPQDPINIFCKPWYLHIYREYHVIPKMPLISGQPTSIDSMSSRTQFGFYCCKILLHYIIKYNNWTGSYFYLHTKKKNSELFYRTWLTKCVHPLINYSCPCLDTDKSFRKEMKSLTSIYLKTNLLLIIISWSELFFFKGFA